MPSIDAATARVLDVAGVEASSAPASGCCGAIRQHLDDQRGALDQCRRNIDAWWPLIDSGQIEAIVINASGCAAMVKDYGDLLRDDPAYADKARRIAASTRDLAEYLPDLLSALPDRFAPKVAASPSAPPRVVFHPPCTLQHGMKIRGKVEALLQALGAEVLPLRDSHLCCGSAGTYSLLQTELSTELRARKLECLLENRPEAILSANIGCLSHLEGGTEVPVRHWVEWVDQALSPGCRN